LADPDVVRFGAAVADPVVPAVFGIGDQSGVSVDSPFDAFYRGDGVVIPDLVRGFFQ